MAKKNKIKNWVIPGVVGGVVIILTVASIVSGSIQQKKEKESMATTTITMPITVLVCGPDFANIHGQM